MDLAERKIAAELWIKILKKRIDDNEDDLSKLNIMLDVAEKKLQIVKEEIEVMQCQNQRQQ